MEFEIVGWIIGYTMAGITIIAGCIFEQHNEEKWIKNQVQKTQSKI